MPNDYLAMIGKCGGLVVEPRTPERELGSSIPTSAVLCPWANTHLLPGKVLVIPNKRWLCPEMTEKLFTGTLSLNKTKPYQDNMRRVMRNVRKQRHRSAAQ